MKSKKFILPTIIGAAVLVIAIISGVLCIAKKPTVTEAEFPFSITYELNGETKTITDVYTARYVGNTGYADTKNRAYSGKIGDKEVDDTTYTIGEENGMSIVIYTNFYADHMMGDPEYDYFEDEPFEPRIFCYDKNNQEYGDEETLSALKVKIISWEYSEPIENSLVFSHLSILSGQVVIPSLLVSLLAVLLVIILIKRDKAYSRKPICIISTVLNFVIGVIVLPFFAICSAFVDISGDNESILIQIFYFIPAITALCIALSIGLRRKLHGVGSLIVQFIGPAVFVIIVAIESIIGFM